MDDDGWKPATLVNHGDRVEVATPFPVTLPPGYQMEIRVIEFARAEFRVAPAPGWWCGFLRWWYPADA